MQPSTQASGDGLGQRPKTIPLKDVRNALMCAKVRLVAARHGPPTSHLGRFAAYTQVPHLHDACRQAKRGLKPIRMMELHFSALHRGDLLRVLERTRLEHGLPEVRRTWGAGLRALKAEFATGVLR
jgi:hypothetical protein